MDPGHRRYLEQLARQGRTYGGVDPSQLLAGAEEMERVDEERAEAEATAEQARKKGGK